MGLKTASRAFNFPSYSVVSASGFDDNHDSVYLTFSSTEVFSAASNLSFNFSSSRVCLTETQ